MSCTGGTPYFLSSFWKYIGWGLRRSPFSSFDPLLGIFHQFFTIFFTLWPSPAPLEGYKVKPMLFYDCHRSPVYFTRTKFYSNSSPSMHNIDLYDGTMPKNTIFTTNHPSIVKLPHLSIWAHTILSFEVWTHMPSKANKDFEIRYRHYGMFTG